MLKVTGPLSYQIKLVNGDTVRGHINNVRRRYNAVDIAVESTVNSESFTE